MKNDFEVNTKKYKLHRVSNSHLYLTYDVPLDHKNTLLSYISAMEFKLKMCDIAHILHLVADFINFRNNELSYCFNFDPRHILVQPGSDPNEKIISKVWLPVLTEIDKSILKENSCLEQFFNISL